MPSFDLDLSMYKPNNLWPGKRLAPMRDAMLVHIEICDDTSVPRAAHSTGCRVGLAFGQVRHCHVRRPLTGPVMRIFGEFLGKTR